MSAQETQKIFDSAAKAAAVLGLRTDEVQGVFLALEQMLSKGKVTTEELRRQLGERLPGAFGIMADAIGVTIPELDRMLKAGEIMSNEALPKFADALQKAYGIESLTTVDNLAAAHGRLKNSWIQFVEALKASNAYITTLDFLNDTLNYVQVAFGYTNRMLDIYLRITDEAGDKTRELVETLDEVNLDTLIANVGDYKKAWVDAMDEVGVRTKDALWMFELYIERRRQLMEDDVATMRKSQLFDINDYKAKLGEAEEEYDLFAATQNETVKAQMKTLAGFYKDDQTTYKQFLNNQLNDLAEHTRTSQGLYKVYQAQIDDLGDKATKEQKQELDVRYQNWQNYVKAYGLVSKQLLESEKTGGTGRDTRLQDAKALNDRLIEIKKQGLEIQGAVDGESKFKEMQRELELINYKKELNENLLQYVEENSREYNQIKADSYKLETEAFRTQIEYRKQIDEDYQKQYIDDMKRWNDERVAAIYDSTNEANVAIQKQASQDLFNTKLTNREKLRINTEAALKVLENEYKAQEQIQELYDESTEEWEKAQQTKADLEQAYLEKSRDAIVQAEEAKRREIQNTLEFISSAGNQAFDVQAQFNQNAMTRAEQRYEREMQLAGDSIDRQLSAKRKYEEEVRKIEKRQAIAQKVQAAFNIGLNTAQAIMGIWAQVPKFDFGISATALTAIVGALGAAQLAAVLAQPLPQFEKGGTVDTDSPIIAGEKGHELMILPSGKQMLTPDKPSILTGVPVGTEIIPNDETTRILAQTAVNKTYDMIDMKQTNSYLKDIRDKESISYQGNYKIVQRKGFYGKYRVR
jgi:tape measure domain-containing protein